MDPLSITASAATVIDAATKIVSYIVKVNDASDDLYTLKKELQLLRNELEDFVALSNRAELPCDQASNNDAGPTSRLPILQRLTDLDDSASPLACCQQKLEKLVKELETAEGDPHGWKGRFTVRRLIWPLKDSTIAKSLQRIRRLRDAIASGINLDTANLAMDSNARIRSVDRVAKTMEEDRKHDQIIKWLNAPDAAVNHHQASEKRGVATTGKWFLDSPEYIEWKNQPHSVYWLHGILGCGKTVLASTIVDDLSASCKTSHQTLAYFYFSFDLQSTDRHDCAKMLHSLLRQLSNQNQKCLQILKKAYSEHGNGQKQLSLEALSTLLRSIIEASGTTFVVLDALDECNSRGELMRLIESVEAWDQADVHILLTSRSETEIGSTIESLDCKKFITDIQISLNTEDIRTHIRSRLSLDADLKRWRKDATALEDIEAQLMKSADGMFLLADRQLDALSKCYTMDGLTTALKSLPATLNDTYTRILINIDPAHRKLLIKAFRWMIYASKALCLSEMVDILAIDVTANPRFSPKRRLIEQEDVVRICSQLIEVHPLAGENKQQPDGSVHFIHLSVLEYLTSAQNSVAPIGTSADAHDSIAQDCLSYLIHVKDSRDEKGIGQIDTLVNTSQELPSNWMWRLGIRLRIEAESQATLPLLFVAAQQWARHATAAGTISEHLFQLMVEAFKPHIFGTWYIFVNLPWHFRNHEVAFRDLTPARLTYAIQHGLERLVTYLLDQGIDVNDHQARCYTPLQAAAESGNLELVKSLIKFGANVNFTVSAGETPLSIAASRGNIEVVELLLVEGADVNQREENGGSALEAALEKGHGHAAHLLLAASADRTVRDELLPRLQDVCRGIDNLLWREMTECIPTGDGTIKLVERGSIPDGIYGLPYYCYFDKSLLDNPLYTIDI